MIVDLADEKALDASLAGGKGSELCALAAKGFAVPPGFVITTEAFSKFIDENNLGQQIEDLFGKAKTLPANDLSKAANLLQEKIRASRLPEGMAQSLKEKLNSYNNVASNQDQLWAVRSSAVAEDLEGASFAGMYDTLLGVAGFDEAARAVLSCWASFFNSVSIQYRLDRNLCDIQGAVVVQLLVDADTAGVCFTMDPVSGYSDTVTINSNFGLGESVVSGRVTPDTFVVDKKSLEIVSRNLADKDIKIVPAQGGAIEEAIDGALRKTPSLTDEQAMAVTRLAMEIETIEDRAVDVEWAIADGKLYLLQSRPITTSAGKGPSPDPPDGWVPELDTPVDPRYPLYSNGNISEVLPGCITPLSWSYIGPTIEHAFRAQGVELGSMEESNTQYQVLGFFLSPALHLCLLHGSRCNTDPRHVSRHDS